MIQAKFLYRKRLMTSTLSLVSKILLAVLLISSLLAGCTPAATQPTPAPTVDQATLIAAAVKTISAQMTSEALAHPSPTPTATETPVPPTDTPAPPTETPTPAFTATMTPTQPPAVSAEFLYAADPPTYARKYTPNVKFDLALGFKNTGSVTWTPGYRLKLVNHKGEITCQEEVELGTPVAPGAKVEFNLWAFGSETLGQHTWVFQLYTAQGIPVPGGVAVFSYTAY
jgi:hypothetical protein